jgi:hypothetical protein
MPSHHIAAGWWLHPGYLTLVMGIAGTVPPRVEFVRPYSRGARSTRAASVEGVGRSVSEFQVLCNIARAVSRRSGTDALISARGLDSVTTLTLDSQWGSR